ncbi:tRNA (guanine26-N2/guanine27-N2)-dimethyltransferase [Giardia muris]|uniref:tRNA (guanine(26)-N(2))-dimethyltransferase n=1 Tax=Giardia muris TaxID=5742 RepID=A0A4Z1TDE7_GIAMU|nr:tRNA (guanine26-N2/guanine27-N2)-dimethyltransferase [Giardia muris]|eukprot:TNJ30559.1 tRNA (guanine26-N2/guanine27-N2)-dimethyltransferase [Giardia muris]
MSASTSPTQVRHSEGRVSFMYDPTRVFFNPTQVFNRDISVLAISAYLRGLRASSTTTMEEIRLIDCLSASGLRAIRYMQELPVDDQRIVIIANDISSQATAAIAENAKVNVPKEGQKRLVISCSDASKYLQECSYVPTQQFHVIDIDPYGSPAPFIRAALEASVNDGLLCITATDGLVTCGRQSNECLIRYGCAAARSKVWCHEGSIRIIIGHIAREAAMRRWSITPVLSFFKNHYLRTFCIVDKTHKYRAQTMFSSLATVYHCQKCTFFCSQALSDTHLDVPTTCPYCGTSLSISGPMWWGSLHDREFIQACDLEHFSYLKSLDEIRGHLEYALAEVDAPPLSYLLNDIASFMSVPSLQTVSFCSVLERLGYTLAPTHSVPGGFKTNAPFKVIIGLMFLWYCLISSAKSNTKELQIDCHSISKFRISVDEAIMLLQKHFPELDPSIITPILQTRMKALLGPEEPTLVSFLTLTDNAQLWFRRGHTSVDGKIKKRPINFKPNPEPNWGPKKAR